MGIALLRGQSPSSDFSPGGEETPRPSPRPTPSMPSAPRFSRLSCLPLNPLIAKSCVYATVIWTKIDLMFRGVVYVLRLSIRQATLAITLRENSGGAAAMRIHQVLARS